MSNKRVLVLTGTSDVVRETQGESNQDLWKDRLYEEVFELTLPSKIRYAKKHGYDLMCLRSFGSEPSTGFKDTNIGLLRALRSFEMLRYYDAVMWIDADAIITNESYSLRDFGVDDHHCLYASYDWEWKHSFSTGNFIIVKNPNCENLFRAFLHYGKNYTEGIGEEQKTLNFIHQNTPLGAVVKILDHCFLNGVPDFMPNIAWKTTRKIICPWDKSCFLAHLTGETNANRIWTLKNPLKEYL